MMVDTALFVMSAGEAKEDSTLVCFTESRDREVCMFESVTFCQGLDKDGCMIRFKNQCGNTQLFQICK